MRILHTCLFLNISGFYPLFPDLLGDFKNFFHQTLNFDAWIGPLHSSFPNIPFGQRTLSCLRKWRNSFLVLKTMESHLPFANPHLIKEWCVWVLYALHHLCPYCLSCEGSRVDLRSMDPEWIWTACCDLASYGSPHPLHPRREPWQCAPHSPSSSWRPSCCFSSSQGLAIWTFCFQTLLLPGPSLLVGRLTEGNVWEDGGGALPLRTVARGDSFLAFLFLSDMHTSSKTVL